MSEANEKLLEMLSSLCVFRDVLSDPVVSALIKFLEHGSDDAAKIGLYCEFANRLYLTGKTDFSEYVADLVRFGDDPLLRLAAAKKPLPKVMKESADRELEILSRLASLTPESLKSGLKYSGALPEWDCSKIDLSAEFEERLSNIEKHGFGIYAKYRAFRLSDEGILPISTPDPVRLGDLIGYQREKKLIIDNTRALLEGKPAANILLTGDAGTGKSSTVKAVVNELFGEGLRILELKKEQLHRLPEVLGELNLNPLKFIIFIDDLSFTRNDDDFSALKATLEGSVSAKAKNVVIYATSNRRHLVKESFSERDGDDIHHSDTVQETVSLSERFGLRITFSRPDKATYIEIARKLLEENGVTCPPEKLEAAAERFALSRSSRSARAARQFVDSVLSGAETL